MPVWGLRLVHCGEEMLHVTLYSGYDNFDNTVRLYEAVLQRPAEEQKPGFCLFMLYTEPGRCLQLATQQCCISGWRRWVSLCSCPIRARTGRLKIWTATRCASRTMTQQTSKMCKGNLAKKESDGVLHQMTWPPQVKASATPDLCLPSDLLHVSPRGLLRSVVCTAPSSPHPVVLQPGDPAGELAAHRPRPG